MITFGSVKFFTSLLHFELMLFYTFYRICSFLKFLRISWAIFLHYLLDNIGKIYATRTIEIKKYVFSYLQKTGRLKWLSPNFAKLFGISPWKLWSDWFWPNLNFLIQRGSTHIYFLDFQILGHFFIFPNLKNVLDLYFVQIHLLYEFSYECMGVGRGWQEGAVNHYPPPPSDHFFSP